MKKIATTIASMALIANMVLPAFALASSTDLEITGNGSDSQNVTNVTTTSTTAVTQSNNADITNHVNASSSTGSNSASKNTGGAVSVDTGNSKTVVSVKNDANTNTANVTNCNCDSDATVKVAGNGADSKNNADLNLTDTTIVTQNNSGTINNKVNADSSSGDNKAKDNTGGNTEISTGNAVTNVGIITHANSNAALVGGNGNGSGSVSLTIAGNGADSKNNISLALDRDAFLTQTNSSSVNNDVYATSSTGGNNADKNTGGESSIDTGNAWTGVAVDNAANFNWANIDCDCLTSVNAKVAGNGSDTKNKIKADLSDVQNVIQDNSCNNDSLTFEWDGFHNKDKCGIDNNLNADSATGDNSLKDNTGNPGMDPEVMTGDSTTQVGSENSGNSNVFGQPVTTPEGGDNGVNVNVTFNLNDLLNALGIGAH